MLALLVALGVREQLADGVKRHFDIDVTEIGQGIAHNVRGTVEKHGGASHRSETHNPRRQATRTLRGARDRDLQPQDQGSDAAGSHRQISRGVGEGRKRLEALSRYLERRQVGARSGMSAYARRAAAAAPARRRGDRIAALFAAMRMSAFGTKRTNRDVCYLSAFGAKADISQ